MDIVKQTIEIREWLQDGIIKKEQDEEEPLGCLPIEEVEELLKKCACELGIE